MLRLSRKAILALEAVLDIACNSRPDPVKAKEITRRQGVPQATITAIREKHTRGVPPEDAQIIDFTLQLIRKHRVDDAAFKAVQARFGNDQLLQLTGAIGYYVMLDMTVNACELEAAPGAEVLKS